MALHENTSLAPVNQRVLGSSPRGGAFYRNPIYLFRLDFLFLVCKHWVCQRLRPLKHFPTKSQLAKLF